MRKRSVVIYWLLIIVPTLGFSAAAFKLLLTESRRIQAVVGEAASISAQSVSDSIQLTMDAVAEELLKSLKRIPPHRLEDTLLTWEQNNPLVRHAFIWHADRGLILPSPSDPSTVATQQFIGRYQALFASRQPWEVRLPRFTAESSRPDGLADAPAVQAPSTATAPMEESRYDRIKAPKKELLVLVRKPSRQSAPMPPRQPPPESFPGHWMPWFAENRLNILAWVTPDAGKTVYGVEVELMALLSRLLTALPTSAPDGTVLAVVDDNGRVWHQIGTGMVDQETPPALTLSLSPALPHWQISVHRVRQELAGASTRGLVILSALLILTLVAAVMTGGILLTRQAQRSYQDARRKTTFVSNVSHELKTPLTSIRMYAELLLGGRATEAEKRRHYLEVITGEAQRLTRLVNNVLDFSRLEQGRKKYRREELDVTAFLNQFADGNRMRVEASGMTLTVESAPEPVFLYADKDALEQILLNLVDNSIKYASAGKTLTLRLEYSSDQCAVAVMDRGPGISARHQKRVFEKFHRVDDSLTTAQPGSGLGLSIALGLARGMGGDIKYTSRADGGACFRLILPKSTPPDNRPDDDAASITRS